MNRTLSTLVLVAVMLGSVAWGQEYNGAAFYGDPPNETHPWSVHDRNRPQPVVVTPGNDGAPPSDAVVLFDGTDLSQWELDKPKPGKDWIVREGAMECVPGSGYIKTKEEFGDCQLHVEWAAPAKVEGNSQGRGNSGIFLMGMAEVQVLDNFDNPSYADGMAASVYGINPPMANALRPPGEFQSYDIIFRRPIWKDGVEVAPGYMTVFCNGVLVQDHTILEGSGGHKGRSNPRAFPEVGPLKLQDHGNPVRFRNIWYRPLPPRAVEGGTDGAISPEAALAKRAEIAASIREHAATLANEANPLPEFFRTLESLIYAPDDAAIARCHELSDAFVASVDWTSAEVLEKRKGEIMECRRVFDYMTKAVVFPEGISAQDAVVKAIAKQGWDEKK